MKKMMAVLSLFVVLQGWGQTKADRSVQDLVGIWRNSRGTGFDIVDSNTVYIVRGDQRKLAFANLSDVSKNPVTFTLTVKDSSRITTLKTMLMVVNDNVLQWQVFESDTKRASYRSDDRSDMLFLKRIDRLLN